jgi:hypothetical protein
MKFTAAAIALAGALTVDAAVLGERATYAVKGKPEGMYTLHSLTPYTPHI